MRTRKRLRLVSRQEFTDRVLWGIVYKARATLTFFNGFFDLSRLAIGWRPARGATFAGGISLRFWEEHPGREGILRPHQYRPEVRIRSLDSKRPLIQFSRPRLVDEENLTKEGEAFRGHFVDGRAGAYAFSDRGHTLASACRAFGVPDPKVAYAGAHGVLTPEYIDYNRLDVEAAYQLYRKLEAEHARHPIDLPLSQTLSPAAVAKGYLRSMGVRPVLDKSPTFPVSRLGEATTAYFGGRAECRIRLSEVPVVYCDLASMYPTVVALGQLWPLAIARTVIVADATQRARHLLVTVGRDDLLDPAVWPEVAGIFCRIRSAGELVPVRATYAATGWQIGLNYLDEAPRELWFTLADLLADAILGGPMPEVIEAFRVVPRGIQSGLRSVKLRGVVEIDPRRDDFFVRLVEERARLKADRGLDPDERDALAASLKTNANAASYGIWAEMRDEPAWARGSMVEVAGLSQFRCRVPRAERIGEFCFPPLAATITGLARLLLAVFQSEVESRGGSYLACDTDSLIVVASQHGGVIDVGDGQAVEALTWADVDEIRSRLNRLNPYDRGLVPDLVKLEDENFARREEGGVDRARQVQLYGVAISAKRFVLYEQSPDGVRIRKRSEHGLGALLAPMQPEGEDQDWIDEVWLRAIAMARGLPPPVLPGWYRLPALSRLSATNLQLLNAFRDFNQGRVYADQVKPANFLLLAHDDALVALPAGRDRQRLTLVAPFSNDPSAWLHLEYRNRFDGTVVPVTTRPDGLPGAVRIKTYGDVIALYLRHPEGKSGDAEGQPCGRSTVGLLSRLHVRATRVRHIGKESNRLEEVEGGQLRTTDDPIPEYLDERGEWAAALPSLRAIGVPELARRTGMSERTLRSRLNSSRIPHARDRKRLMQIANAPIVPPRTP